MSTGSVVGLVASAVRRHPRLVAVRNADPFAEPARREVTYAELWSGSGAVAEQLTALGIGRGDVVALAARRSTDLVVALLGILRSGAAFLPLDAGYPAARLDLMLEDTAATVVLGHADTVARLSPSGRRVLLIDELLSGPAGRGRPARPEPSAGDLCYVLYTSGTTGRPKGILMTHGALLNIVEWQAGFSAAAPGEATLQYSAISFDVSFQEIFATLASAGTVVCPSERQRQDPSALWAVIAGERIARVFLPYVALQTLVLAADCVDMAGVALTEITTAGEQLQCSRALREMMRALPGCRLVNQYGPSEAHVVTHHVLGGDPASWVALPPIGRPVPGNLLAVLDEYGDEVGPGEIGDIHVGGVQVALGYHGLPDLTADRFRPDPAVPGGRRYRTGDMGRRRSDGALDYLGRADDQVKIRGFRLEIPEVEHALDDHPDVRRCGVAVRGEDGIDKELVGFVVTTRADADLEAMRAHLALSLPDYMIPTRLRALPELPLMPSGKLDRPRLQTLADLDTHGPDRAGAR
jgi:amino acid adenylation domain-containing protein